MKLESGGLLVTGHLPLLDLFLPLLRAHAGGLPGGVSVALMPREISDQATFSQPFPKWTVTLWPGLGSCLRDTICYESKAVVLPQGTFGKSRDVFGHHSGGTGGVLLVSGG